MTSAQIIIFGFYGSDLYGSTAPHASHINQEPGGAPFLDALFTSTSAVCVTGLIVHDTATYWTEFGQFVIISLIQVGGMGVVTVAVAVAMVSGKKNRPEGTKYHAGCYFCTQGRRDRPFYGLYPQRYVYR